MQLARVVGRIWTTIKVRQFEGLPLMILEPLDEQLAPCGELFIAGDPIGVTEGQIVYWESSMEARYAVPDHDTALDAAICGLVDHLGTACNSPG